MVFVSKSQEEAQYLQKPSEPRAVFVGLFGSLVDFVVFFLLTLLIFINNYFLLTPCFSLPFMVYSFFTSYQYSVDSILLSPSGSAREE